MTSVDEFVAIVRDEIGLPVTADDIARDLAELPGWDSVHLLTLLLIMERRTGRRISMPDVLEAKTLEQIYLLAVER
ncbi:acyl carrier protein [Actinocrispum wychmicini]|uniref:Phosphopantetheine binding protein n=1 Tax=Actinocrispum wychmicini TaxID=1213861 RepID=A0A4R2JY73_9PSEU|nr:acyl carrier protein [Actinocrispum wychmicini]TCO62326.1 phosphopantetheine binding protein [Actinocrispum wychmicini]